MKTLIKSFFTNRSIEELIFSLVLLGGVPYFIINEIIDLQTNQNMVVLVINTSLLLCIFYLLYLGTKRKLSNTHIFVFSLILAISFALFWPSSTGLSGPGAYVFQSLIVILLLINRGKANLFFAFFLVIMMLVAGYVNMEYSGKIVYASQLSSFLLNTIVIASTMNLFKRSLQHEQKRVIDRINEQQKANKELIRQNAALKKNQEEIIRIQTKLQEIIDERTIEIEKANDQMVKYAFINAHLVRAPLANIIGLSELKKAENEEYKILHEKIGDLDKVVRKIGGVLSV